jgi:hypothetical protein
MFSCVPLVVRFGGVDDMVLLMPLLLLLHRRYVQPCQVIGSGSPVQALGGLPARRRMDQVTLDEVLFAWQGLRAWARAPASPDLPPDMPQ